MNKKVAFYTLGCKLNFAETSYISKMFIEKGYKKVDFENTPDIFVINTCSVTDNADKKCAKIVKKALHVSPHSFIIVTGCFAQLKPKSISTIPGVDAVLGSNEKFKIFELINNFSKAGASSIFVEDINKLNTFETAHSIDDRTRAFLKVQDGCNYFCSFCTIPLARGRSRSDTVENVLNKIQHLSNQGIKEIVLTGVNLGDFGIVKGKRVTNFLNLIKNIENLDLDMRFRISSVEPNLLENEIIDIVAKSKKFVPHFHIPLQSGNNDILKNMRRKYNRELYIEKVDNIKERMPQASIGVDVIVGFPGETHEKFLDTYNFLKNLNISYLHVFPYSERENTRAISMSQAIPIKERYERANMLRILSEKKKRIFYENNLNSIKNVLFENDVKNNCIFGYTENYIKVSYPFNKKLPNTIKKVKLSKIQSGSMLVNIL